MKQNKTERLQAEVSKIRKIKISSRGRTPDGGPNPIDTHVGNRIRLRRQLLGYSQEKLASLLGLTFQQVQKYEKGMNRVGASRLWDMGKVLGVPISFFFEDMDETEPSDPMLRQETIELVKAYYKLPNRKAVKHLYEFIVAMSKTVVNAEQEEQI